MSKLTGTLVALLAALSLGLAGCDDDPHYSKYNSIYIQLLENSEPVTFQLNDGETLTIDSPGRYRFNTRVRANTNVNVKVVQQPAHQTCYTVDDAGVMPYYSVVLEYVCDDYHRGLANATEIAVGERHSCAIENEQVTCWGTSNNHETEAPALNHPRQLGAGAYHSCVLDDAGVHCWGALEQDHPAPTNLGIPEKLFVDRESACALDGTGTPTCWGNLDQEYFDLISGFTGLSAIGIGDNNVCTRADNTLTCWRIFPQTEITLQRTIQSDATLYFGFLQNCMISSFTVECWQNNDSYGFYWGTPPTPPQPLSAPSTISLGTHRACLVDNGQVQCWPQYWFGLSRIPATINAAQKIAAATYHACAIDAEGVICWGDDEFGATAMPNATF
jgi:hypothetical protein